MDTLSSANPLKENRFLGKKKQGDEALFFEFRGDAEVEVGGIGQDGERGALGAGGGDKGSEALVDAGEVVDDFDQADDGEVFGSDYGADSGGAEFGSGAAEEVTVGPLLFELGDELGGVVFTGGFARRDEDGSRSLGH